MEYLTTPKPAHPGRYSRQSATDEAINDRRNQNQREGRSMSTKYHIGAGGTENNAKLWWRFVCDENNKIVAQARGTTEEEAYFEASFICKACNSHASLAELVRQSLDRFTDNDMQPPNHALEVWVANAITTLDFDKDTKADKLNKLSLSQQMRKDGWGLQEEAQ